MYRDFSAKSKNQLLSLVSQVENEKVSNFTDWVGDRWLDFQSWIGKLNIRNYLNNVNEYHKKVIDKNNATKKSIENIFKNVASVDLTYSAYFSQTKSLLEQWQIYIREMGYIVNPSNGCFNADFTKKTLSKRLATVSELELDENALKTKEELTKDVLKKESKLFSGLAKLVKKRDKSASNNFELTSSAFSYIAGLYTFYTADYKDTSDIVSGSLKLTKDSTKMFSGVYKHLEGNLLAKNTSVIQAAKFGKKFGKGVGIISLIGNLAGFGGESINTFKTLVNEDAEGYEKLTSVMKSTSAGTDVAKSVFTLKWGQKVLTRGVTAKYQWGTTASNASKLSKANAIVSVIGVGADTITGMANAYGKVSADGVVDSRDFGEIGIRGSIKGLTSVVGKLTFGITDIAGLQDKSDKISDNVINYVDTKGADFVKRHDYSSQYVQNAQFLMDYADDTDNNIALRIGASAVAGTGMIGAVIIDGVGDGCSWVGNKISNGWNTVKSWF